MAEALVSRNIRLVYGGASIGIMGTVADQVLKLGGQAIGVIPKALAHKEVAHKISLNYMSPNLCMRGRC